MQVSSAEILFSPTVLFETPRSSCGLLLTWCALRESSPLFSLSQLLAAMGFLPSPIVPVAPVPSCAVKPLILFGSVGLLSRMFPNYLVAKNQHDTRPDHHQVRHLRVIDIFCCFLGRSSA